MSVIQRIGTDTRIASDGEQYHVQEWISELGTWLTISLHITLSGARALARGVA